jgi:erythritol transport system ATP-binding protein
MSAPDIILEARSTTKRYPGTIALDRVTFRARRNQVNVLIGENGAGKSTLMRVLAGVETADEGGLLLDGVPVVVRSPREAAALGISIVHQELSVLPNLDISDNIFAGRELVKSVVFTDRGREDARSLNALRRLRMPMRVRTQVAQLPLGGRQVVEAARTLDQGARILILDEPTSALSTAEADSLFGVIAELKRSGVTIIYISHRLHELLHLGDHFTVLRSGRIVGDAPRAEVSRQWIVERMSGRAESADSLENTPAAALGELYAVRGLSLAASSADEAAQAPLHDVSFAVRQGEILGVYGLLGAGKTELLEALTGCRRPLAGEFLLQGKAIRVRTVADAVNAGIVLVPEDRQRDGLVSELSIRENVALGSRKGIFVSREREAARVRELVRDLNIHARDLELPVSTLSGGNQQKALIARCLMRLPRLLLLDEPTRGVDVGAKEEIYRILRRLASQGLGIVFTSSEIEETRKLADRVLVLRQGRIAAEFARAEITDEALFAAASPIVSASQDATRGAASL